ncbi:hypothetical protein [Streptomyces mirabilis]|uniref:hypothetical protein n=1 Tax=Streptomyces mirabilis TaxID=68239 RepID=UPI00225827ED|nr:hypothetical protein [Streptomyces mirabilis]MCX4425949.1 hypothetical protein [Streptomyces mirabilis]
MRAIFFSAVRVHVRLALRNQQHPARSQRAGHLLQLRVHGRIVHLTGALGLDELADHHLRCLQPGHLGVDLRELLA